jgi:hypothetical protein
VKLIDAPKWADKRFGKHGGSWLAVNFHLSRDIEMKYDDVRRTASHEKEIVVRQLSVRG